MHNIPAGLPFELLQLKYLAIMVHYNIGVGVGVIAAGHDVSTMRFVVVVVVVVAFVCLVCFMREEWSCHVKDRAAFESVSLVKLPGLLKVKHALQQGHVSMQMWVIDPGESIYRHYFS